MIFDHDGAVVSVAQKEHEQIFPRAGWVEHDPVALWINNSGGGGRRSREGRSQLGPTSLPSESRISVRRPSFGSVRRVSRSTTRSCGRTRARINCVSNWAATRVRTSIETRPDYHSRPTSLGRRSAGFSTTSTVRKQKRRPANCASGTVDTWIVWNLTEGVHVTDVTNASRTMLMDLETLQWDESICADFGIPMSMLPEIRSSSEVYGTGRPRGNLAGVPVAGILGDQQASTFGQACLSEGEAKNTYGTGNFMLLNTGTKPVHRQARTTDDRLLQTRRSPCRLRTRRFRRRDGFLGPVASRQSRNHSERQGHRAARRKCR